MTKSITSFLHFVGEEIVVATQRYFGPLKAVADYIARSLHD